MPPLPNARIWAGPGTGQACAVCGQPIGKDDIGNEVELTSSWFGHARLTIAHRPAAPFDAGLWTDAKNLNRSDYWNDARQDYQRGARGLPAPRLEPYRRPQHPDAYPKGPCAGGCGKQLAQRGPAYNGGWWCRACRKARIDAQRAALPADFYERLRPAPTQTRTATTSDPPDDGREAQRADRCAMQDAVLDAVAQSGPPAAQYASLNYKGIRGRRTPRRSAGGILTGHRDPKLRGITWDHAADRGDGSGRRGGSRRKTDRPYRRGGNRKQDAEDARRKARRLVSPKLRLLEGDSDVDPRAVAAFRLVKVEGKTQPEAAKVMRISQGKVSKWLKKAIAALG